MRASDPTGLSRRTPFPLQWHVSLPLDAKTAQSWQVDGRHRTISDVRWRLGLLDRSGGLAHRPEGFVNIRFAQLEAASWHSSH